MINFKFLGVKFQISFLALWFLVWFLVHDFDNIFLIFIISSILHELFHIFSILFFSAKVERISLKLFGISIKKNKELPFFKEIIIILSGCFCNILIFIIFIMTKFKKIAIINLIIFIYNVIFYDNLDGGQAIRLILNRKLKPKDYEKTEKVIQIFFKVTSTAIVIFLSIILKNKIYIIFWAIYFFITVIKK